MSKLEEEMKLLRQQMAILTQSNKTLKSQLKSVQIELEVKDEELKKFKSGHWKKTRCQTTTEDEASAVCGMTPDRVAKRRHSDTNMRDASGSSGSDDEILTEEEDDDDDDELLEEDGKEEVEEEGCSLKDLDNFCCNDVRSGMKPATSSSTQRKAASG